MSRLSRNTKPRLCFVGPMVARHKCVTTQGEILSELFAKLGYSVVSVSHSKNRYVRLVDVVATLVGRRSEIDIQCLQVFGGRSFVIEDIASSLAKLFNQKLLMFLRGGAMPNFMARHPKWTRRVLSRADVIVAPSSYLAGAVETYGFKARIIPNVIVLDDYQYRHRRMIEPRLFWMRAFDPIWNPLMAIRVLARLHRFVPDATLAMAGEDKGMLAEVRCHADRLGLNGSVRFCGFLDKVGKVQEGNRAEIFINTNRIDNMPVSVIEACAMGLPVVSTAVGGIPDVLTSRETGLLVPDNDDAAMVEAILNLLRDQMLAGNLSANGRRLAERSSWEHVHPQLEQLFVQLLQERPRQKLTQRSEFSGTR